MSTSVVPGKVKTVDNEHGEAVAQIGGREIKLSLELLEDYVGQEPHELTRYSPKGFAPGIPINLLQDNHGQPVRVMPATRH